MLCLTRHHRLLAATLLSLGSTASAQSTVPVRELSAAEATSTKSFGNLFNVRALPNGRLLVNDGVRRQLVVLDQSLSGARIVVDSVADGKQGYGPRAAPLIPYLGDSTLFVDGVSLSLLVLDGEGRIARVMSAPRPSDLGILAGSSSGVDRNGNLIYRTRSVSQARFGGSTGSASGASTAIQALDSAVLVRANFEKRSIDTVGRVRVPPTATGRLETDATGKMVMKMTVNPLTNIDEWAVLSDGSIAFVRGQDYHVDWLYPDGTTLSSPKLPFDWKRLSDADKQALIDSARTARASSPAPGVTMAGADGLPPGASAASFSGGGNAGGTGGASITVQRTGSAGEGVSMSGGSPGMSTSSMGAPQVDFVPLSEIPDYHPPIRAGAARADIDGRLWILPTTSAQSKAGELIYDVVSNRGQLLQRVRVPVGRSIAGFGRGGIVYLMYRDGTSGWKVERTHIVNDNRTSN